MPAGGAIGASGWSYRADDDRGAQAKALLIGIKKGKWG